MTNQEDDELTPEERAALRDLRWGSPVPPELEDATLARLRARGTLRPARRSLAGKARAAATLAAACACFLLGYVMAPRTGRSGPDADARPQYLILLYEGPQFQAATGREATERVAEYAAWARQLAAAGHLLSAGELRPEGETVTAAGPSTRANASPEDPVGYFLIGARDRDEALRLTRTCPHLRHAGRIDVRPLVGSGTSY